MTQPLLLHLAKQGNANAIASLMNAALHTENIRVKVRVEDDQLQVMMRSSQTLNQHASVAFIRRGMLRLKVESIQRIIAYAWRSGDDFPDWIAHFRLDQPLPPPPDRRVASKRSITQSIAKETAAAPEPLTPAHQVRVILQSLNRRLQSETITVKAGIQNGWLHILLEATPVPAHIHLTEQITAMLRQLPLDDLERVTLYGRQPGTKTPVWTRSLQREDWCSIPEIVTEAPLSETPTEETTIEPSPVMPPIVQSPLPDTVLPDTVPSKPRSTASLSPKPHFAQPDIAQPDIAQPETVIAAKVADAQNAEPTQQEQHPISAPSPALITPSTDSEVVASSGAVAPNSPEVTIRTGRKFSLMELGFAVAVAAMIYFMMATP